MGAKSFFDLDSISTVEQGSVLFEEYRSFDRELLVRYAGASGDFNPIHYSDVSAENAGLSSVLAQGMLTMGCAGAAVSNWLAADSFRLQSFSVKFAKPVPVLAYGGMTVTFVGELASVEVGVKAVINISAMFNGESVLGKAQAVIDLS